MINSYLNLTKKSKERKKWQSVDKMTDRTAEMMQLISFEDPTSSVIFDKTISDNLFFLQKKNMKLQKNVNHSGMAKPQRRMSIGRFNMFAKEKNNLMKLTALEEEKMALIDELSKVEKQVQFATEEVHRKKLFLFDSKTYIVMKKRKKVTDDTQVRAKNQRLMTILKEEYEYAVSSLKKVTAEFLKKTARLKDINRQLKETKNELFKHYHQILTDIANFKDFGLEDVFKSIFKIDENVLMSFIPNFIDGTSVDFSFKVNN